jgi:hypothetical protein
MLTVSFLRVAYVATTDSKLFSLRHLFRASQACFRNPLDAWMLVAGCLIAVIDCFFGKICAKNLRIRGQFVVSR